MDKKYNKLVEAILLEREAFGVWDDCFEIIGKKPHISKDRERLAYDNYIAARQQVNKLLKQTGEKNEYQFMDFSDAYVHCV